MSRSCERRSGRELHSPFVTACNHSCLSPHPHVIVHTESRQRTVALRTFCPRHPRRTSAVAPHMRSVTAPLAVRTDTAGGGVFGRSPPPARRAGATRP